MFFNEFRTFSNTKIKFVVNVTDKFDFYQMDVNDYWQSNERLRVTSNIFKIYVLIIRMVQTNMIFF